MFFHKVIARSLKFIQPIRVTTATRAFNSIHDKHFEYLRTTDEYKNSVIQMNDEVLSSHRFSSFLNDYNIPVDDHSKQVALREAVMNLPVTDIKDLLNLMANAKLDTVKFSLILKFLDEKCASSTERWPLDISFYILDAWFLIWGSRVFRQYYYSALTNLWGRRMKRCSKNNLILMLYYIGASKTAPPFLMESIAEKLENYANVLSDQEWGLACLSFFKTSKPMVSTLLLAKAGLAAENLLLKNDRFNVIAILKCFRLSKYHDGKLWSLLKDYILKHGSDFNFVECTNFLATFASQNIYDQSVYTLLQNQAIGLLESDKDTFKEQNINPHIHPSQRSRVKDIARFLWTMTSIGHCLKPDALNLLVDSVQDRLKLGEFDSQTHILIDCLQSFVLANIYPQDILSAVFGSATLKKTKYSERAKPKYQLYFIQKSALIEKPEFEFQESVLCNPIPKHISKDMKERLGFKDLLITLSKIENTAVKACYIIPHIMISGIILGTQGTKNDLQNENIIRKHLEKGLISTHAKDILFESGECFCIELLDRTTCAENNSSPNGLMATKIRQLKKLGFKVFTVYPNEVEKIAKLIELRKFECVADIFLNS